MASAKSSTRKIVYRCYKCGLQETNPDSFFKSNSSLYDNHGYMPICRSCLNELFNRYSSSFHDPIKAIKRICMAYDIYYSDKTANSSYRKSTSSYSIGDYLKKLNIIQNRGKTFDNSIAEGFTFYNEMDSEFGAVDDVTPVTTVPKTVQNRWGEGFNDSEYKILEEHYRFLKDSNPNCDSNQELFIIDLCHIQLRKMSALKARLDDDYIKLSDAYRKTFQQAGLKTIRDTSESENFLMGVTAETIEKYTPAEFYADKELYKDFDNIGDYIERFMLRPLRNLMHGSHDRDKEYYVKDETDDGDFDEE